TNRMQDLVMRAVQEVNADKKYKMVVNANSLLDADTTLNITPMVLEKVNELYAKEKNETK
ncbi:MAG: OmpH family outer membrane protein, partial [Alistipes sp.]|nr:OmpH family outer membrane protein [Alistipes sp.]